MKYIKSDKFIANHNVIYPKHDIAFKNKCIHGYESGHSAICPGHPSKCQHGFTAGHSVTCPGGQNHFS